MRLSHVSLVVVALFLGRLAGFSQGFVNLNFENANLTGYPPESTVPATNAFPGWAVSAAYIPYDDLSLSGESTMAAERVGHFPVWWGHRNTDTKISP